MSERDLDDLLIGLRDAANPLDDLAMAEARVLDRLDRTMESRPQALRAAFRSARRTVLALVAVGGVATGAAATAAIAIAMPSTDAVEFVASPANPEKVDYTAVERSSQQPGAAQRAIFRALARRNPGVRPDDARGIRASDGTQAWVIPGEAKTCFGADNDDGTGFTCTSNAGAVRGALSTASVDDDGTVRAIYLVPDSVTAVHAGDRTFTPESNLAVVSYPLGSTISFVTKSGDASIRRT